METNIKLEKIKSKYVIEEIFKYIENNNFIYKFFSHSKLFQSRLSLELYDYQERYIKHKIGEFNISSYLYDPYDSGNLERKLYILTEGKNIEKDILDKYALNHYQKYWENLKNTNGQNNKLIDYYSKEIPICIDSPFFDILSKEEIFEKIFSIIVPVYLIGEYYLPDYIKAFKKLEESNINNSSLRFLYKDIGKLKICLEKSNINFMKIKRLFIIEKEDSKSNNNNTRNDYFIFYEKLFSLNNIGNNLEYLKLSKGNYSKIEDKMGSAAFKNLNSFNSLEQLDLFGFRFRKVFKLKLESLKVFKLENCENITLEEKTFSMIKYLSLKNSILPQEENLLKLNNLEKLILFEDNSEKRQEYNLIIDFSSLVNLLYIEGEIIDVILLENNFKLKELIINSSEYNTKENELKLIELINSLPNLENIKFFIKEIGDKEISEIQGVHNSVTTIEINWMNPANDCILLGFQKKFPNLTDLIINIPKSNNLDECGGAYLLTKENAESKLKNLKLIGAGNTNIELYCNYEILESIEINVKNKIKNLKEGLAFLMYNCPYKFNKLRNLQFTMANYCFISKLLLRNLYNNIDKMQRLKCLVLKCTASSKIKINDNFKNDFYEKIKKLNLDLYSFSINDF